MSVTQVYKNVTLSILDLTEIEFALEERLHRHELLAAEIGAREGDAVLVLIERDRAALAKVRAEL